MRRETSRNNLERMDKAARALELRIAGWKVAEIAPQIGYKDLESVYNLISDALAKCLSPVVEEYRSLINERYETIISTLWPKVLEGDFMAIDRVCKILKDQATLHGLHHPQYNRNNQALGTVTWQPLTQDQEDRMRGRIDLIEVKQSSTTALPAIASLPAEPVGEKISPQ